MSLRPGLIGVLLLCWTVIAPAQTPVVYTPPEGDFRVLFPAAPVQSAIADGAVAYSAVAEEMTFIVYRRDPAKQPIGNPARSIEERLRGGNEELRVQRRRDRDGDANPDIHEFVVRGQISIHRLFVAEGRYYETVVRGPRGEPGRTRAAARDFFGSFQIGSAPVAAGALAKLTPDVICKDRSSGFFRTFCEYSYCLRSQHRGQPYCQNLLRLR
jgi:hypothetical protein